MYKPGKESRKQLKVMEQKGKAAGLVLPDFKPFLEKPVFIISVLLFFAGGTLLYYGRIWQGCVLLGLAVILFSIKELFIQDDHALVRIYGPFGRLRYIFEDLFRDKYLQYFNETNTDGRPIPRIVRDYIYQKAHNVKPLASFGTELDNRDTDNTAQVRILHRNFPSRPAGQKYKVVVGEGREGIRPFSVRSVVNVSGMSYGSLNFKACEALSIGAKEVAFVNTGEGGYGPHGIAGNDVVFQLGTGKFGVGKKITLQDGTATRALDEEALKQTIRDHSNIGMIQLKISQGAKPGLGGHLPGDKVTPEIAAVRRVNVGETLISPPQHVELMGNSPQDVIMNLMQFCKRLREITELPVSIKMCVGRLDEIDLLVSAMQETGEGPDHIQLDGADGGTGAGPNLYLNYVGYGTAAETLGLLNQKLINARIRDRVRLSVSGKMLTPVHAALAFARGADWIDAARSFMLAIGCIQSLKCHTNHCPTGIATNNPWRIRGLNVPEKSTRVHNFLVGFNNDMQGICRSLGHSDPRDINLTDLRDHSLDAQLESAGQGQAIL